MKNRLTGEVVAESRVSTFSSIVRLVQLLRPYRLKFVCALLALFIGSAINLVFPEVIRRALDPEVFPLLLDKLHLLMGALGVLFAVQGVAFFIRSYLFGMVGQQVFHDVRGGLFRAIVSKDIRFFDRNRSGELASRINSDAALVQEAVSTKLSVILRYGLQVVLGVALMLWMSWRMTAAIVMSVLVMMAVSAAFLGKLKRASRSYQSALARLTAFASECFSGAKVMRALAAESDARRKFTAINRDVLECGKRRTSIAAAFSSGASAVLNLLLLAVLWYGIHLVLIKELPLNDLAAFVLYGAIVAVSFSFLVSAYVELMQSLGGLERVFELLEGITEADSTQQGTQVERHTVPLSVELQEVSFSYPDRADVRVVDCVSLSLLPGKTTALVGPSGSGKSSIVQLLLSFYSPDSGEIMIEDRSLSSLSESEIRSSVAWVPQEPHLFGFSIYENLVFGNRTCTSEEILETALKWEFLDFVRALPEGIHTTLGEHGTQLSGGQRQRIAIARAMLRKPRLLILDEATSGLDSESEARVLATIRAWLPNCTVLLISHRLATVQGADVTYVMHEGRILQHGTHEELRRAEGLYKQYATRQALV
jgi:subfamily B ATP-binding cassette protein MsbA